jgi:hypothetical protein
MAKRGPKLRTAANAAPGRKGPIRHGARAAPSVLSRAARAEYDRLLRVLDEKGTLDRVDLSCVAECARIKALLDLAYDGTAEGIDWGKAKLIGLLSGQHRGRLRELGLTLQPSRSVMRTNAVPPADDPIAKLIKLS